MFEKDKNKYVWTTFALRKEQDRLIIKWLDSQANKSEAIRKALAKEMVARDGPDLQVEMLEILRELQTRQFTIAASTNGSMPKVEEAETAEMAEHLNSLFE